MKPVGKETSSVNAELCSYTYQHPCTFAVSGRMGLAPQPVSRDRLPAILYSPAVPFPEALRSSASLPAISTEGSWEGLLKSAEHMNGILPSLEI